MDQSDLMYIRIPYPDAGDLQLKIVVPTIKLVISPGIGNVWVTGKYNDPREMAPLNITQTGNVAQMVAMGVFAYRVRPKNWPDLSLSFGRLHPFSLSISAGDASNRLDLGGIPLSSLEIQYGSGPQYFDFSYPSPQVLDHMRVQADNGPVHFENLANANAAEIHLSGDSTIYKINFGGMPKQNTDLHFGASISCAEVLVPTGTAVKVISRSSPTTSPSNDFSFTDQAFFNLAARERHEPLLTIFYPAGFGPLKLKYI